MLESCRSCYPLPLRVPLIAVFLFTSLIIYDFQVYFSSDSVLSASFKKAVDYRKSTFLGISTMTVILRLLSFNNFVFHISQDFSVLTTLHLRSGMTA